MQESGAARMNRNLSNPWFTGAPVLMSLVVLAMLAHEMFMHGVHAPHHDEGLAGHLASLLMLGQIPLFAAFIWSGRGELRHRWPTLIAPIALWALTVACARG